MGDELYLDEYDNRFSRRGMYDRGQGYGTEYDSDGYEYTDERGMAYRAARRKEGALLDSALDRIDRARSKGQTNINLTMEEFEAYERRRLQPEPGPPAPQLASPPATPGKPVNRPKITSRSNSSNNLAGQKTKKKTGSSSSNIFSSPSKANSKAKVERKRSTEQALTYPPAQAPPPILVQGPHGQPVYAPLNYYGPPSPELTRSRSGSKSKPGSRSASKHSRRESTPPEHTGPYPQYPPRYYVPHGGRPESSGSNRSLPDEIDWYPPAPRQRSASNRQYYEHPADYDLAPMPAAPGRRNVSGPADVRYASLRRVPPSPHLAARALASDPAIPRQGSGLSREFDGGRSSRSGSGSSSDDQGVQVEIVPGEDGRYTVERVAAPMAPSAAVSGNQSRKRKGVKKG